MSTAIKATNSKGLKIINCGFQGFDIDIELNNVEDFTSQGNTFSRDDPNYLLKELINSIKASSLSQNDKKELFQEIITFLSRDSKNQGVKDDLIYKIANYIGNKAVDCFLQLTTAVSAGLILKLV